MNPIPIILQLIKKEMKVLLRARFTSFIIIFGPFLLVLIIGQAYSTTDWHGIKVGLHAESLDDFTVTLTDKITDRRFTVENFNSLESCINGVKHTDLHACIFLPASATEQNRVEIYLDYSRLSLAFGLASMMQGKIGREGKRLSVELTRTLLEKLNTVIEEVSGSTVALDKLLNLSREEMDLAFDDALAQIEDISLSFNESDIQAQLGSLTSGNTTGTLQEAQDWIGGFKGEVSGMEGNLTILSEALTVSVGGLTQMKMLCNDTFNDGINELTKDNPDAEFAGFPLKDLSCGDEVVTMVCGGSIDRPLPDPADIIMPPPVPTATPVDTSCLNDNECDSGFVCDGGNCVICSNSETQNYFCQGETTYFNECAMRLNRLEPNDADCNDYCPCPAEFDDPVINIMCNLCDCVAVTTQAELDFANVIEIVDENKDLSRIEIQLTEAEELLGTLDPMSLFNLSDAAPILEMLNNLETQRVMAVDNMKALKAYVDANTDNATSFLDSLEAVTNDLSLYTEIQAEEIITPIQTVIHDIHSDKKTLELLYPAVIILILMMVGVLSSTTIVINEKKSQATMRNLIAPVRSYLTVSGIYITNLLIMITQLIFVLFVGLIFFNMPAFTNFPAVFIFVILLSTVFILFGMCIGYLFKNPTVSNLVAILLVLLFLFLSGVLGVPIESMPENLSQFIRFNPYLIGESAMRKLFIIQLGLGSVLREIGIFIMYVAILAAGLIGLQIVYKKRASKG